MFHNINSISSFPRHKISKEWAYQDNCTKFDYRLSSYILDEVGNAKISATDAVVDSEADVVPSLGGGVCHPQERLDCEWCSERQRERERRNVEMHFKHGIMKALGGGQ